MKNLENKKKQETYRFFGLVILNGPGCCCCCCFPREKNFRKISLSLEITCLLLLFWWWISSTAAKTKEKKINDFFSSLKFIITYLFKLVDNQCVFIYWLHRCVWWVGWLNRSVQQKNSYHQINWRNDWLNELSVKSWMNEWKLIIVDTFFFVGRSVNVVKMIMWLITNEFSFNFLHEWRNIDHLLEVELFLFRWSDNEMNAAKKKNWNVIRLKIFFCWMIWFSAHTHTQNPQKRNIFFPWFDSVESILCVCVCVCVWNTHSEYSLLKKEGKKNDRFLFQIDKEEEKKDEFFLFQSNS